MGLFMTRKEKREPEDSNISLIDRRIPRYCGWLNEKTKEFRRELEEQGIKPQIGFEVERYNQIDPGVSIDSINYEMVYDIKKLKGIAFDNNSNKIIVFWCEGDFVNKEDMEKINKIYFYDIIDFKDVINVKVEVNSNTTFQSSTSNKNMLKRSLVGGILLGSTGAIIGGTTAQRNIKQVTTPTQVEFTIQTINLDAPAINFKMVGFEDTIVDTMISIFSDLDEQFLFEEETSFRNKKKKDIVFQRNVKEIDDDYDTELRECLYENGLTKVNGLKRAIKIFNYFAMQIETIIKRCDLERQQEFEHSQLDKVSLGDEIAKLVELKEKGILTEEEFLVMKKKLI